MTQLILDLPDALAVRAQSAGLLDQQAIVRLLDEELRRLGMAAEPPLPISQVSESERLQRVRKLRATMDRIAVKARRRGLTDEDIEQRDLVLSDATYVELAAKRRYSDTDPE